MAEKKLTPRQKAFVDAYLENPIIPMAELGRAMGIPQDTIYKWRMENKNGFKDAMEEGLARKWEDAKYMASDGMISLAREGDFKALKYILDYSGYAPKQKIDVDSTVNLEVSIEE